MPLCARLEVGKAFNSCRSTSAINFRLSVFHSQSALWQEETREDNKQKRKRKYNGHVRACAAVFVVFLSSFLVLKCFSVFISSPVFSSLCCASCCQCHQAHSCSHMNPPGEGKYVVLHEHMECVYVCVSVCVAVVRWAQRLGEGGCSIYTGQPLMTVSPTGLDLPKPDCVYELCAKNVHPTFCACLCSTDASLQRWVMSAHGCVWMRQSVLVYQLGRILACFTFSMSSKHIFNSN